MTNFSNGVDWYDVYKIDPDKFSVNFPEGNVCCAYCPMLYADGLKRPVCRFTLRVIEQPIYAPFLPSYCVLSPTGKINGKKKGE